MLKPHPTLLIIGKAPSSEDYRGHLQREASITYQVLTEPYGTHALDVCRSHPVDSVLLKLEAPYSDSLDFLRQLKDCMGTPPIIVVGNGDAEVVVQAFRNGATDYLVEGRITPDELRLTVRSAIENAQLRRELQCTQEQFQTSVETMLDCFGIFSAMRDGSGQILDFRIDYLNQAACENNRMTRDMQVGRGLCEILPGHRESGLFDEYCQVVETGEPLIKESLIYEDTYGDRQRLIRAFDIRATKLQDGFVASWRDITPRKQLELELNQTVAALQVSQQHYQALAEAMPQMVWTADATGAVNYWNLQWYAYTGLSEAESLGVAGASTVHPEERDRTLTQWSQCVERGKAFEIEYRIRRWDGVYHWFICRGTPTRDSQGQVTGWTGTITDIDERKQLEERLHLVLRAVNSVVFDWDLTTNEFYRSDQLVDLIGIHAKDSAPSATWWHERIHPDDLARLQPQIQALMAGSSELFELEYRVLHRDGHWVEVWDRGLMVRDNQGQVVRIVGSTMDVSDRKQAELALQETHIQLEAALSAGSIYTWRWQILDNLVIANQSLARLFGVEPEGAATGLPIEQFLNAVHPDDLMQVSAAIDQALLSGNGYATEFRVRGADGQERWVIARGQVEYDAAGNAIAFPGALADITDRKHIEMALQESQERLTLAMEAARMGSWTWDIQTGEVHWSDNLLQLFGITPGSFDGRYETVMAMIHPEDLPWVQQAIHRAVYEQADYYIEFRFIKPDGTVRWALGSGRVFYSATGQPLKMTGVDMDITARKQVELLLRDNEERFRTLADNISQFAWITDETGAIVWYNQRWFDYTGTTLEEMQGWGWQQVHHPDHVERVVEGIRHAFATEATWEDTFPLRGKDGQYRWFLSRAIPLRDEQGKVVRWFGTNTDITDLRQTELALQQTTERLNLAIESAQLGTWDWNLITNKLTWDAGCKAMFGLPPDVESNIDVFFAALDWDDRDRLRQVIQDALQGLNGGSYDVEYRITGIQDRVERWIKAKGQVYFDPVGKPLRFAGTVLDITQQKQAEAEREALLRQEQAAREAAERANRIKDEFLAVLSHELRSPLNPILGWSRLLQMRKLDDTKTAEALATIERNAKVQTQLIDDLLDVAKILRGKLSLTITSVNLVAVIEAAMDTVKAAAVAKSITLHTVLPNGMWVAGDAARLQQVVWNLLSNAIKFTPQGGHVDIVVQENGRYAEMTVKDTGKGIHPDFLPHIFESFRQEDASTTRRYGGLGLGLAIVHQLVEAHNGTVTADSPGEGLGATFTIGIPLLNGSSPHPPDVEKVSDVLDLQGIRILVVDDEPDARDLLVTLLTQYRAEVMAVNSATEVLATLASFQPDVLVSDIGMPHVDGNALIQKIRALPPEQGGQVPAIALTAYASESDRQRALSSGYQQHIMKPLELEPFIQELMRLASATSMP